MRKNSVPSHYPYSIRHLRGLWEVYCATPTSVLRLLRSHWPYESWEHLDIINWLLRRRNLKKHISFYLGIVLSFVILFGESLISIMKLSSGIRRMRKLLNQTLRSETIMLNLGFLDYKFQWLNEEIPLILKSFLYSEGSFKYPCESLISSGELPIVLSRLKLFLIRWTLKSLVFLYLFIQLNSFKR